jgi:DAK2 domain fusion protein YloV
VLETLDAAAVRRWCGGGLAALRAHQHEIDELNVYPVPDGDTGTNLVLTMAAAQEALEHCLAEPSDAPPALPSDAPSALPSDAPSALPSDAPSALPSGTPTALARAMRRMARGALLGARGNSGVIVSQILRGMADSFATSVTVRGSELARALRSATEAAYGAVARPVEGTVLSVVAAAAEGAGRIKSDDLLAVARAAARSAGEALARTPQQLPALARAGVVDAGGRGLCLLLDALVDALAPTAAETDRAAAGVSPGVATVDRAGVLGDHGASPHPHAGEQPPAGVGAFGYEVQYLLDADDPAVERLRGALDRMGDSLVVVGTGDGEPPTWNVHVHVPADRIGPAVEAGVGAGRPYRISVTPLQERIAERRRATGPGPDEPRGAVVVAAGDGLTALFQAEGAVVVDRNPSIGEMLAAITAADARSVVLLPNDANTHAVATAAAREAERAGIRVSVVPTRSPVQAVAALAVRDAGRPFADDVIAMAEAAGACRYGEVCTAQRAALTVAGPCRAGDLLGLVDGEVHVIGADLEDVSRRLLDRMLGGGGELATLVLGADAPDGLDERLREHITQTWPFVELQSYAGGQPRYHLLVGVE